MHLAYDNSSPGLEITQDDLILPRFTEEQFDLSVFTGTEDRKCCHESKPRHMRPLYFKSSSSFAPTGNI